MTPRKVLFWIHLSLGTIAGIIILIMSVTSILLAYERQITEWSIRSYRVSPADGPRLPMDALMARAQDAAGRLPSSIRMRSDADAPIEFGFGPDSGALLINAYTGATLRQGDDSTQRFFSAVESWHRWLGMKDESRELGRNITATCNLAFLVLIASGPFLWWPKNVNWSSVKRTLFFQRRISGRARNFNWHNVTGIWCFAPLLLIVLCSTVMSYVWANNLLYRIAGDEPPKQSRAEGGDRTRRENRNQGSAAPEFDSLLRRAQEQVPGWKRITLRVPQNNSPVVFTIEVGNGGRPDRRSQLTLNPGTAEVLRWEPFSSYSMGRRLRGWARFVHTGEAGGIVGQTIALSATSGATLLVWTGLSLVYTRFNAWRKVRQQNLIRKSNNHETVRELPQEPRPSEPATVEREHTKSSI